MFCTKCGSNQIEGAAFCSSCGNPTGGRSQPAATDATPVAPIPTAPTQSSNAGGLALAIIGLLVAAFALFAGLYDLGGIANGQFAYVQSTEVGLLALLSILGVVMGAISMSLKHPAGRWALIVSVGALVVMFNTAGHMLPTA